MQYTKKYIIKKKTPDFSEVSRTIEELKPGEEMEIDPSEITFGRMLPPVTQYVERKKEPTITRKEFNEHIKEEKDQITILIIYIFDYIHCVCCTIYNHVYIS